jgi:RNA polymerase sigma-70 factor (ECF subfamily)
MLAEHEPRVVAFVSQARAAWPDLSLSTDVFLRHVDSKLGDKDLEALRGADLFLACACANGDKDAIAAFEQKYAGDITAVLAKMRVETGTNDELRQTLRTKLFVNGAIAEYAGWGDLKAWLRVVFVRMILDYRREHPLHLSLEESLTMALEAPTDNPELELMKRAYAAEFRDAFHSAITTLSERDRKLLHAHFVEGLPIERLGEMHDVHRTTASRWLAEAQKELMVATRKTLKARLKVGAETVESILDLIQSRLELSLESALVQK